MLAGGLFTSAFLKDGIRGLAEWNAIDDAAVERFAANATELLAPFLNGEGYEEAETEQKLVFPLLEELGWGYLPQQKTSTRRENIPDALLFASPAEARAALNNRKINDRYKAALVVEETKAWDLRLDRGNGRTPANQALHYLDLAARLSEGRVRWGLLTNGRLWRLYWQDAGSRAEHFLEADLPWLLQPQARDSLRSFMLLFGRDAFIPDPEGRSFILRALDRAREFEETITEKLSKAVFAEVYPALLAALSDADPAAAPEDPAWVSSLRDAALVVLYRMLFLLYAEDRDLLPKDHPGYAPLSITGMRRELREAIKKDRAPGAATGWWRRLAALTRAVDTGNDRMGLPPYNGGLFATRRAPLLDRVALPDRVLGPILAGLAFENTETGPAWINYRDLSVQQLGTIYEALLERAVKAEGGRVVPVADDTARHTAGIYYTRSDALVRFTLGQAVDPLLQAARSAFDATWTRIAKDRRSDREKREALRAVDPATAMLKLRVLDPAMGSGHFLVALADHMADAIIAAIGAADEAEEVGYVSPLAAEIAQERAEIEDTARTRGWTLRDESLNDRQIIRRFVLKRVLHGVDLNPLAVDLAKLSLWLHSFTVGAPLSFLDHHLRVGDSLLGAGPDELRALVSAGSKRRKGSELFLHAPLNDARNAARSMTSIEELADADIAQVHESQIHFAALEAGVAPLRAFLDAMAARDHLPKLPRAAANKRAAAETAWLDGLAGDPVAIAAGATPRAISHLAELQALLGALRPISAARRFLHWPVAFPNVWKDLTGSGGFDAVIGNPPYVRQEAITALKAALKARYGDVYDGAADLYVYFFALALHVLRPGGRFAYVVNNKWLRAGYAEKLRGTLADAAWLVAVTDFGHAKGFFPGVDAFPSVVCVARPDPALEPPTEAQIAAVPRDLVRLDALAEQIAQERFPLPRAAFTRDAWVLEPPNVRALLDKLRHGGVPLKDYAGAEPYRGVSTGLNDAFIVNQATRDRLVADDHRSAEVLKPLLRGQDIDRWGIDWAGLWLIFTRRGTKIEDYPAIHRHLREFRTQLEPKPDDWRPSGPGEEWPGRKPGSYAWFEIQDEIAYFEEFSKPKIIWQAIQYNSNYTVDLCGFFLINKAFAISNDDHWLVASLASPAMWWFNWRHFGHMKDEALSNDGVKSVHQPIPAPSSLGRERADPLVTTLTDIARARQQTTRQLRAWYAAEWGITSVPRVLADPFALDTDGFTAALRAALPAARRRLSSAAIAAIQAEHAATIAPMTQRLGEAVRHERTLSDLVNQAFGLTPDDVALMWQTAPPRMPIPPPG